MGGTVSQASDVGLSGFTGPRPTLQAVKPEARSLKPRTAFTKTQASPLGILMRMPTTGKFFMAGAFALLLAAVPHAQSVPAQPAQAPPAQPAAPSHPPFRVAALVPRGSRSRHHRRDRP